MMKGRSRRRRRRGSGGVKEKAKSEEERSLTNVQEEKMEDQVNMERRSL